MNVGEGHQPWFERYPDLYASQVKILNAAGFHLDDDVFNKQRRVQFIGYSKADPARQLIVAFPQAFPSSPPKIFDTPASKLLSRHHRMDSRQLCLFGFNESRWSATLSVAEALAEAEQLISQFKAENANAENANQPPEPISRTVPCQPEAAILVPPPISTFNGFGELKYPTGKFFGKFIHEGDPKRETHGRGVICAAEFGNERIKCSAPYSDYLAHKGKDIVGDWYYLQDPPTAENLCDVLQTCFKKSKTIKKLDFYWIALIFGEESGEAGKRRLTWLIARASAADPGKFHVIRTFPYAQHERSVRIPGLEGLQETCVMVVGCGSLGSKIAANLAASGVNRFHLVDFDYFEPNNAVRHELGVDYFGLDKARALLSRLCSLNPAACENSKSFRFQVGGISSFDDEQSFYNLAKESNIIVDATGSHSASHFLNNFAFEMQVPLVVVSVTNGAWSGEIVRIVPGKTPCWLCWLDQYFDHMPPSAPVASAEVFAPGCDQPTFTGTTYDLGIVAGLATSAVVDTLLGNAKQIDWSKSYIRWSGRDKNGKPLFLTEVLSTDAQPQCWCSSH